MDAYVTKPVEAARLLEVIDELTSAAAPANPVAEIASHPRFQQADNEPVVALQSLADLEAIDPRGVFLDEVIDSFLGETETTMGHIRVALSDRNLVDLPDYPHAIASIAAHVGTPRI